MSAMTEDAWHAPLEALGALLRAQRLAAGLTLRELSERTKVSNAYLSQLERGLHEPSLSVLRAIAARAGRAARPRCCAARACSRRRSGDAAQGVRETEAAIIRDPELSEPQRVALLSVYRSFVPVAVSRWCVAGAGERRLVKRGDPGAWGAVREAVVELVGYRSSRSTQHRSTSGTRQNHGSRQRPSGRRARRRAP